MLSLYLMDYNPQYTSQKCSVTAIYRNMFIAFRGYICYDWCLLFRCGLLLLKEKDWKFQVKLLQIMLHCRSFCFTNKTWLHWPYILSSPQSQHNDLIRTLTWPGPGFFEGWLMLSTRSSTIQWISVNKTNHAVHLSTTPECVWVMESLESHGI